MKLSPPVQTASIIIDRYAGREMILSKPELLKLVPDIKMSLVRKARQIFLTAGIGVPHGIKVKGSSPSTLFRFPDTVTDDLLATLVEAEKTHKETCFQPGKIKPTTPERISDISQVQPGLIVKAFGSDAQSILMDSNDCIVIRLSARTGKPSHYEATLRHGQHFKRLTGTYDGSVNACLITAAIEALSLVKKCIPVVIAARSDFYSFGGRNSQLNRQLLNVVQDKKLPVCICIKNRDPVKK